MIRIPFTKVWRLCFLFALLFLLALLGCGGTSTTNQPPPGSSSPAQLFFGSGPDGVRSFAVAANSAALTPVSLFQGSNFAGSLAVPASGKFLYAAENITPGIEAFSVSNTGTLTRITGSPFPMPTPNFIIGGTAVDPAGNFLFASDPTFGHVAVYRIDSTTGALTVLSTTFSTGPFPTSPEGVAVAPSGKFLYVANSLGNSIAAFTIDASTGNLTAVTNSPFATSVGMPLPVVVHPSGKFLYTALTQLGGIDGFTIDSQTGALTKISGSPFLPQSVPSSALFSLTLTPSGKFLFIVNPDGSISDFSVDPSTGILTQVPRSPFPPLPPPSFPKSPCGQQNPLTVDPSGSFLYVSCANPGVTVFTINATTGAIAPVAGDPNSIFGPATFQTNGSFDAIAFGHIP